MAKKSAKKTKDIKVVRELVQTTDPYIMMQLCAQITHLKMDPSCHMDRAYAQQWYESHYLTGKHVRFVMKPGLSINHVGDGVVYRAFNCTDEIAERIMKENAAYKDYFEDLGPLTAEEVVEDTPTILPADPEPETPAEPEAPAESEETPKEDAPVEEPTPEEAPKEDAPAEPEETPKEEVVDADNNSLLK